eukprot:gene24045-32459_t
MSTNSRFRFSIDRGGTFTDIYCEIVNNGSKKSVVVKLLSEDPANYDDAPTEGIRRILQAELVDEKEKFDRKYRVDTSRIDYIRMGTTVATNALLERKGERIALITTKGFRDLQQIGNQSRPKIFDLKIQKPELLYEHVVEVNERVVLIKDSNIDSYDADKIVVGKSHERLFVEKSIDEEEVIKVLQRFLYMGITSIAVISLSSEVSPMIRMVARGGTTCVDAYLTPVIKSYLASFCKGFDDNLRNVNVSFMQSDGGLTPMSSFLGNKAILSGPAGGVVGYAFEHVFETTTAGVSIQSPQLDINTVAAGGGSRLFYKNGLFSNQPLDVEATTRAFEELTELVNSHSSHPYTSDEVAYGFIKIANEAMARPIRNLTTMKGYDATQHALACFGGAGPQHCCAIAKSLGMKKVLVHRLSLADVVIEKQEPFNSSDIQQSLPLAIERLTSLEITARSELQATLTQQDSNADSSAADSIVVTKYLSCRFILNIGMSDPLAYSEAFVSNYRREYGFELENRSVLVDDVRVRAVGRSSAMMEIETKHTKQTESTLTSEGSIVFFVASRGHHADVGGIAPGSMPPLSKEGAAIVAFKLVVAGSFQEEGIARLLLEGNTRCLGDNISDLKAQVAANNRGNQLMQQLVGTGAEVFGNLNAPPAVTASAVIYCLRCLLADTDIPLNQIRIPRHSVLNPSDTAAVVGGNVLTSQRACAASQGCMNNLTFGDSTMGYYETIAGGAGTNTRITDPEILERRYPVILRQFSIRRRSGGKGRYRGGDGVVRELEFTRRRAFCPYGMNGGESGQRGLNLLHIPLKDRIAIHTPGGGGYGVAIEIGEEVEHVIGQKRARLQMMTGGSLSEYTMRQETV